MDENEISDCFEDTVSIRLSKTYSETIDKLVKMGIYVSSGEILREGLRYIFEKNGIRLADKLRDDR